MTDREYCDRDHDEAAPAIGNAAVTPPIKDSVADFLRRADSTEALRANWKYWNDKIVNAPHWGAALAVAAEFRDNAARELRRRGDGPPR